jgi:hypothetical protein
MTDGIKWCCSTDDEYFWECDSTTRQGALKEAVELAGYELESIEPSLSLRADVRLGHLTDVLLEEPDDPNYPFVVENIEHVVVRLVIDNELDITSFDEVTMQHLAILRHALGLNTAGEGESYRNNYTTGPRQKTQRFVHELAAWGLMLRHEDRETTDAEIWSVTECGREFARK